MSIAYNPKIVTSGLVSAIDFDNIKSFSPNTFSNGLDIYTWYTTLRGNNTGNACTVSQDLATSRSPVGGIPMRMDVTGNDAHISSFNEAKWNISSAVNGQTWYVSFYAKASTTLNNCEVYIFGANSSGVANPGGTYIGITSKTITVTTEWQRFDHFITFNNANIVNIQMRLDGPNSGGTGTSVWWDGLQVEPFNLTNFNASQNINYTQVTNLITSVKTTVNAYPQYNNSGYLIFNGTNNFLGLTNTDYPSSISNAFSVECTLNIPSSATWSDGVYRGSIFTRGSYQGSIGLIRLVTNNVIGMWVRGDTGLGEVFTTVQRDTWYNCVGTWNGVTVKLYINGVLASSADVALTGSFESQIWYIGSIQAMAGAEGNRFAGNVSTAKIYNKELSLLEIQQNFNAIRGRYGI